MTMRIERVGSTLVVKLYGEVDQHCADEIRADIDREINVKSIKNLVFDFAGVTFMDSSGIGMIIGRYKQIKARGGRTLLVRAQPQVDKILDVSGIKKILECG